MYKMEKAKDTGTSSTWDDLKNLLRIGDLFSLRLLIWMIN